MLSTVVSKGTVAALAAAAVLAVVAWLVTVGPAHAQGVFSLSANPSTIAPGETTAVDIIASSGDAAGVKVEITYDANVLDYVDDDVKCEGGGGTVSCFNFLIGEEFADGEVVTSADFTAKAGAADGDVVLGATVTDCQDALGGDLIGCTVSGATITIETPAVETATPTPSPSPTPAALPDTGGTPDGGSDDTAAVVALSLLGVALVAAGGFAVSRIRREPTI